MDQDPVSVPRRVEHRLKGTAVDIRNGSLSSQMKGNGAVLV